MAWSPLEMYQNGLDFFDRIVEAADPQSWGHPSPCEGWNAADVLGHVGLTAAMGGRILRGEDVSIESHDPPSSSIDGDPVAWWNTLASEAREALGDVDDLDREIDTPMGRRSIREGLTFPAVDLFIHGWDLAVATGRSVTFPDEAVAFVRKVFDEVPEEAARRPGVFSAALVAPPDSNATEELLAWCGRDPRWAAVG